MMTFKTAFVALALSGLAIGHGAVPVRAGETSSLRVKPLKVVNLTLGTKRAIGYFTADNGACNMTMLIADVGTTDTPAAVNAARVNTVIGAGTSSRVDTESGPSVIMACETGAAAMNVQTVERVAYAKAQTQQR